MINYAQRSLHRCLHTALMAACGIIIAQIFHALGLGHAFLPLHIPVVLAGLLLGSGAGAVTGLLTPLISSLLTGMPQLFPQALRMSLELTALGGLCGLGTYHLYQGTPWQKALKKAGLILGAILVSRLCLGLADTFIFVHCGRPPLGLWGNLSYSLASCLPGTALLILVLPPLAGRLERHLPELIVRLRASWKSAPASQEAAPATDPDA